MKRPHKWEFKTVFRKVGKRIVAITQLWIDGKEVPEAVRAEEIGVGPRFQEILEELRRNGGKVNLTAERLGVKRDIVRTVRNVIQLPRIPPGRPRRRD